MSRLLLYILCSIVYMIKPFAKHFCKRKTDMARPARGLRTSLYDMAHRWTAKVVKKNGPCFSTGMVPRARACAALYELQFTAQLNGVVERE